MEGKTLGKCGGYNLYLVQDCDRPMYVIAKTWSHAVSLWRHQLARDDPENAEDILNLSQPEGISLVAEGTDPDNMPDIIFPETLTHARE